MTLKAAFVAGAGRIGECQLLAGASAASGMALSSIGPTGGRRFAPLCAALCPARAPIGTHGLLSARHRLLGGVMHGGERVAGPRGCGPGTKVRGGRSGGRPRSTLVPAVPETLRTTAWPKATAGWSCGASRGGGTCSRGGGEKEEEEFSSSSPHVPRRHSPAAPPSPGPRLSRAPRPRPRPHAPSNGDAAPSAPSTIVIVCRGCSCPPSS